MKRIAVIGLLVGLMLGLYPFASLAAEIVVLPSAPSQARRAKLDRIAILVNALSEGKSRLLISFGVSADPSSGFASTSSDEVESCVTVYPLSSPLTTCLTFTGELPVPMIVNGKILGAVGTVVPIGSPGDKKKAGAGTYLVFVPMSGFVNSERVLVSLDVGDDGKLVYRIVARTSENIDLSKTPPILKHGTAATPEPKVTADIKGDTAAASISWGEETYKFAFEVDYTSPSVREK